VETAEVYNQNRGYRDKKGEMITGFGGPLHHCNVEVGGKKKGGEKGPNIFIFSCGWGGEERREGVD